MAYTAAKIVAWLHLRKAVQASLRLPFGMEGTVRKRVHRCCCTLLSRLSAQELEQASGGSLPGWSTTPWTSLRVSAWCERILIVN